LTALNKIKSNDFYKIDGKTSFIFREIWIFPKLNGISPFIFQTLGNQHSAITEPNYNKMSKTRKPKNSFHWLSFFGLNRLRDRLVNIYFGSIVV
jgi:hypothetical protein